MKSQKLRYYMHDGPSAFRFELAGDLDNAGAREIEQAWRTASSLIAGRVLLIDMTFVTSADEDGRALLARWHAGGARLIARSKTSRDLAEGILGVPLPGNGGVGRRRGGVDVAAVSHVFGCARRRAHGRATLPPAGPRREFAVESVAAWDDYIRSVSNSMQERARPGGSFLWTYESPERIAKVLNGGIFVAPAPGPNPRKVPGGLIHHWIAAAIFRTRNSTTSSKLHKTTIVIRTFTGLR